MKLHGEERDEAAGYFHQHIVAILVMLVDGRHPQFKSFGDVLQPEAIDAFRSDQPLDFVQNSLAGREGRVAAFIAV